MMGTLFIKYAKLNKVRQAFNIATSIYGKKALYVLYVPYYKLYVFCPYILTITSPNVLSYVFPILCYTLSAPHLHTVRPPSNILAFPTLHMEGGQTHEGGQTYGQNGEGWTY